MQEALDQNGGDMEKAIEWLRSQNKKMGVKREGNETAEGRIGVFIDNAAKKVGAIVELRCESAPSAKNDQFIALANDLAKHVADEQGRGRRRRCSPSRSAARATVQDRINDVVGVIREKMILHKFQRLEGGVYGGYVHHDGTVGVLLECKGAAANDELLRDVCRPHRGAQPAVRDHRRRAGRRDRQGEGAREGGHRGRPEERRQAGEHPREDRRGQAARRGSPRTC